MATIALSLQPLPPSEILREAKRLASSEQHATAALVACLAEVDARQLYVVAGYNSMFGFCTRGLHLYEGSAYNRIEVARLARRFPIIIERLAAGEVTLTAVRLIGKHLTAENHLAMLDTIRHMSKEKLRALLAELEPKQDVTPSVRKVSSASGEGAPVAAAAANDAVTPLSPGRYKVQFTVSAETRAKLQHAQDLLRHTVPDGDIAEVFDRALTILVDKLERTKFAATKKPRPEARASVRRISRDVEKRSRHIPAPVRRAVWIRDEGRCTHMGPNGRCHSRSLLEFHHILPFARGGTSSVTNLRLLQNPQ
jgi:hypothetical protein